MTTIRAILLLAILAAASSCSTAQRVQVGTPSGLGNKMVAAKEEPTTLVAVDATRCLTTPGKFSRVKSGDRVWCQWRARGAER